MNVVVDNQNRIFIDDSCMGKMGSLPFSISKLTEGHTDCFSQVMRWVMRKYLRGYTINYLSRRLVDRCRPEPCNFWVHEEKIFENKPALDYFTPIVQLLVIGLEFVKECREQPDRVWIILNHIGNEHINVERKTNALNPKLKYLVYERRQGEGLSAADFNTVILPCFKAIIRDLMGVGKN